MFQVFDWSKSKKLLGALDLLKKSLDSGICVISLKVRLSFSGKRNLNSIGDISG